jgi:hypothetical protein
MSTGFIYLLVKLDSIICMLKTLSLPINILLGISIVIVLISYIGQAIAREDDDCGKPPPADKVKSIDFKMKNIRKMGLKMLCWFAPLFLIFTVGIGLVPTTKEMAVIYVVPKIVDNENAKKIPDKIFKLADEWLEKMSPENIVSTSTKTSDSIAEAKDKK